MSEPSKASPPSPAPFDREATAAAVVARIPEAEIAWPGVVVPRDRFVAHVLDKLFEKAEGASPPLDALSNVRIADLYLAFACTLGDAFAMAQFEEAYFAEVDTAYRRFDSLPLSIDDLRQRMREKLFLTSPPALAGYAGQGDVRGWLRAATLHALLNVSTRETRERPTADQFFDAVIDAGANAEAAYLKRACRSEFEGAFRASIERLTNRERSLLRYAFADGLNIDQIGAVFRVHRATAARWVAQARTRLVDETRAELVSRLRISAGDAESIVRAAMSGVSPSLLRELE